MVPFISMRKTRKLRVAVDRTLYRLPNLVDRRFNGPKNSLRVATRSDNTADSLIDITSIRLRLRDASARRGCSIPTVAFVGVYSSG